MALDPWIRIAMTQETMSIAILLRERDWLKCTYLTDEILSKIMEIRKVQILT